MDLHEFVESIPTLSDLELAVLLSLVAKQHCLVSTEDDVMDALASELALIVSEVFKLTSVVLESEDLQSADHFGDSILDEHHNFASSSDLDEDSDTVAGISSRIQNVSFKAGSRSYVEPSLDTRLVVNVVIAKDFNTACEDVQIQVLELIQRKRIYSRTTVHLAPKTFLVLPLISTATKHIRLNHHLNDRIFMSHYHSLNQGFPTLEDTQGVEDEEALRTQTTADRPFIKQEMIDRLRQLGQNATTTPEIRRYLQDIVVFLRLERGVDGGVTPYSNTCFVDLAKHLAPFHGIDFVTPSLIGLAARKVFPHRITIALPARERSLQYGSHVEAVKQYLDGLQPDDVIETVLEKVECPL